MRAAPAILALVLVGCSCGAEAPTELVADVSDFADYRTWTSFERTRSGLMPAHPNGTSRVYINHLPEHGASTFPIGTIVVRETEIGARDTWEVHVMVRRSAEFNPLGAVGWEFFDLRLAPDDSTPPTILWRGEGPANDADGYANEDGTFLGCNHCHGAAVRNDSVIGSELQLTSF